MSAVHGRHPSLRGAAEELVLQRSRGGLPQSEVAAPLAAAGWIPQCTLVQSPYSTIQPRAMEGLRTAHAMVEPALLVARLAPEAPLRWDCDDGYGTATSGLRRKGDHHHERSDHPSNYSLQ